MAYYTRPEEILERLTDFFKTNSGLLGLKYVATQEESLIPEYPCIQIASEPLLREVHGTYTFEHTFAFVLWVYHANLEVAFARRTIEDMQLATRIVQTLHRPDVRVLRESAKATGDFDAGEDKLIFSYVSLETPGTIEPRTGGGSVIVTTRLLWLAEAQERFEHG
jgi:hypothetical protein